MPETVDPNSPLELEMRGPESSGRISIEMTRTLAALHPLDPHTAGLGGFGRSEGFLNRQPRLWRTQMGAFRPRTPAEPPDGFGSNLGPAHLELTAMTQPART
ncbi:hypothetical protein BHE97_01415 [Aeromicrobium sp. PE09-221]|nr:hypothetical protein BHE97_01415 [Aeromicrobium sp. PE09-221]